MWYGSGLGCFGGISLWPGEVGWVYRFLGMVSHGWPGHGPVHILFASAAEIGFWWDPVALAWSRLGLPLLSNLAGLVQHFRAAILEAWRCMVAAGLCGWAGFRDGPLLDFHGSLQLLNSSHVRERDKALLRSIMVGGVWDGFLLGKVGRYLANCRLQTVMVICFGNVPFLLLLRFVKALSFMIS